MLALLLVVSLATQNSRVAYVKGELVKNGFSHEEANTLFKDSRLSLKPDQATLGQTAKRKTWEEYRTELLAPESINRGKEFLEKNRTALEKAEGYFGVKKETVAALIRIEADFGRESKSLGEHTVFNVFYRQLQSYRFWRVPAKQLVALATYCKKYQMDCFSIKGSYAGAFGLPQFMPVSIEPFARDGDGDGIINLFDEEDAIVSATNFLKEHGWSQNNARALAQYYGSPRRPPYYRGYPKAVLEYAKAITAKESAETN